MNEPIAESINTLGRFCGRRDVDELTSSALKQKYGIEHSDVMVLFGGSILAGGDVLAQAIKNHAAGKYIIAGGAGHTTETLRQQVNKRYPDLETEGLSEAEIFNGYLKKVYGLEADLLETRSTNCGNNITYLLDLLKEYDIPFRSIILCQDATMQLRMDAGLRKYVTGDIRIINYASYAAEAVTQDGELRYASQIHGMWDMDRYVNLLMGEIPRLTDDENGYGPRGKDFIAHVDIPRNVMAAFESLKNVYGEKTREANALYAG